MSNPARSRWRAALVAGTALVSTGSSLVAARSSGTSSTMVAPARAFLASLGPDQRATAAMPFASEERLNWHYTAKLRNGLPLKRMGAAQRKAAMDLLRASLSQMGLEKAETIRALEDVLRALEGNESRDPEMYYFSIFGEPAESGTWGWRYEGHHLSFNFVVVDGKVVSTTPQFFGANPADVREGAKKGVRALAREEDVARSLARSLTAEQRALAVVSDTAPPEILTGASREAALQKDEGIGYPKLDRAQQALLVSLIDEYIAAQSAELARARRERVDAAGLEKLKFVWMGGLEKGQGHYYRIQGPTFLIEYDNTQNGANHVHAVWRDFKGDWGKDVLAGHYGTAPHHAQYRKMAAAARQACCFTNPQYAGVCAVQPGEGETCASILEYLNNPRSQGKSYCDNTNVRGGWKQVECPKK